MWCPFAPSETVEVDGILWGMLNSLSDTLVSFNGILDYSLSFWLILMMSVTTLVNIYVYFHILGKLDRISKINGDMSAKFINELDLRLMYSDKLITVFDTQLERIHKETNILKKIFWTEDEIIKDDTMNNSNSDSGSGSASENKGYSFSLVRPTLKSPRKPLTCVDLVQRVNKRLQKMDENSGLINMLYQSDENNEFLAKTVDKFH
jgi:hypothetical protein